MVEIADKRKCCGCTACANICPNQCITMVRDVEGFEYPLIDKEMCIDCNLCNEVCPIMNPTEVNEFRQEGYVVQNKDEEVLRESTSGGAFTALAMYVLKKGGIVYGASMNDNFDVFHIGVETEHELAEFRNSKYVQSSIPQGTFLQIKKYLEAGRYVCFSGTPCQVEGLIHFLGRDYDKLILVDISCHAVPSPLVFHKYLDYMQYILQGRIKKVTFRDKHYGYKYSTMKLLTENNNCHYHHGIESDQWLRAFFSNICDRPSCYECKFKNRYRRSDFTIWDCFPIERFAKELDNDKGATRLLIHTDKGKKVFKAVSSQFRYHEVKPSELLKNCNEIYCSVPQNAKRDGFMSDAVVLDGAQLFNKYFPNNFVCKLKHFVRVFSVKLGIYTFLRRKYVRITHKY